MPCLDDPNAGMATAFPRCAIRHRRSAHAYVRWALRSRDPLDRRPDRADVRPMKIRNSLKSLRGRHRDNQIVRRKGRVYVINKTQKRFKARQG